MRIRSLKTWTTLHIGGVLATSSLLTWLLACAVLASRFDEFELRSAEESLRRVHSILQSERQTMQSTTQDYAQWDDGYAYIQGQNPGFFAANLSPATANNIHMDWAATRLPDGRWLESNQLTGPDKGKPIPAALQTLLQQQLPPAACNPPGNGVFWLGTRPVLVSHAGFTDSQARQPAQGCLLLGRFLDGPYRDLVRQLSGIPFTVVPPSSRLPSPPASQLAVRIAWGNEPASLQGEFPRELKAERYLSYGLLGLCLLVVGLLALFLNRHLLRQTVLNRLERFSQLAETYHDDRDSTLRWPIRGDDELDRLGRALNAMMEDIGRQHEVLTYLAHHDSLTSLGNRLQLHQALAECVQHPDNLMGAHHHLLLIDLDDFKLINDGFGHTVGDNVLQEVAIRLRKALWEGDTAIRLGGDEFAILARNSQPQTAIRLASQLLEQLAQPHEVLGQQLTLTASIGIAPWLPGITSEQWLSYADLAMYAAKREGKHRYAIFDEHMLQHAAARLSIEHDLRHALQQAQLEVWYQPIIDGVSGQVAGMEALVRWRHHGQYLPPDQFIGIAEETGLIVPLGNFVLQQVAGVLAGLQPRYPSLSCNVNLSLRQFHDSDLLTLLTGLIEQHQLPPLVLHLELTESLLAMHEEMLLPVMEALVERGFLFHLDDFGTGYSSLERLQSLPIHSLKIDRRFVTPLRQGEDAIARTIVTLASHLGLEVVAEGVEQEVERQALQAMGVRLMQGYLFARPMPANQLYRWLAEHAPMDASSPSALPDAAEYWKTLP